MSPLEIAARLVWEVRPSNHADEDDPEQAAAWQALSVALDVDETPLERAAADALSEAETAAERWPSYNSAHEGFGVIHEEFDELKAHVWTKQGSRDLPSMRREAIQLAATALRFAADVCNEERGRA